MNKLFLLDETPQIATSTQSILLTPEECDVYRNISMDLFTEGKLFNGVNSYVNPERRIALNYRLSKDEHLSLYHKLGEEVKRLNRDFFRVELTGFMEDGIYLRYLSSDEEDKCGFFGWHKDTGKGYPAFRKLTVIVSLSDPDEYEGGDFVIFDSGERNLGKIPKGQMIVIPSYLEHKVNRVTKGERHTLVFFVSGPRYK